MLAANQVNVAHLHVGQPRLAALIAHPLHNVVVFSHHRRDRAKNRRVGWVLRRGVRACGVCGTGICARARREMGSWCALNSEEGQRTTQRNPEGWSVSNDVWSMYGVVTKASGQGVPPPLRTPQHTLVTRCFLRSLGSRSTLLPATKTGLFPVDVRCTMYVQTYVRAHTRPGGVASLIGHGSDSIDSLSSHEIPCPSHPLSIPRADAVRRRYLRSLGG